MKKLTYIKIQLLLLCITYVPFTAFAQRPDSLANMRELMQVINGYKQMPLYLELEMKNTTNFITSEQDTVNAKGKFYLTQGTAYMNFGEVEQLVTGSVAVLVISKLQRMIVNTNPGPMLNRMKALPGLMAKDSSILTLAKTYASRAITTNEASIIELTSRNLLYGSSMPQETIEVVYDSKTRKAQKITHIKRTLVPLQEADYKKLKTDPAMEKMLLVIQGKGYFLVKEQTTAFMYKTVGYDKNLKIPVALSDRITRNNNGEFEPVKAYENYEITTN